MAIVIIVKNVIELMSENFYKSNNLEKYPMVN